jgi:hypothetical protein
VSAILKGRYIRLPLPTGGCCFLTEDDYTKFITRTMAEMTHCMERAEYAQQLPENSRVVKFVQKTQRWRQLLK